MASHDRAMLCLVNPLRVAVVNVVHLFPGMGMVFRMMLVNAVRRSVFPYPKTDVQLGCLRLAV